MTDYNPPHEVKDKNKLDSMIATLKSGRQLPPVIVHGNDAYTGSHRIAAWMACEMDIQVIKLTDEEFTLALALMNGCDDLNVNDPDDMQFYHDHLETEVRDYNEFCEAISKVSRNEEVLAAIKDQT